MQRARQCMLKKVVLERTKLSVKKLKERYLQPKNVWISMVWGGGGEEMGGLFVITLATMTFH